MKRPPCPWCVRADCPCGWHGYRSRSQVNDPRPCPRCWGWPRGTKLRTTDVRHRLGNICHFIPAREMARLSP